MALNDDRQNVNSIVDQIVGEGMLTHGIFLFAFINPEGKEQYAYITIEEPTISQTLALMAVVQHQIAAQALPR